MTKVSSFRRYTIIVVLIILSFIVGYLFRQYRYKISSHPKTKDGHYLLGVIGDKRVSALSFTTEDKDEGKNLVLRLNDDLVYWETDSNFDGKIDSTKHFDNGILIYSSEDTDFDGKLNRRMVESYKSDGSHDMCMVDLNADNVFDSRIKYADKENAVVEIFMRNKWMERVKKNGIHGIYNAEGVFLPVEFKNGWWITK